MAIVPKPNTFQNGTTADASAVNANFDAIFNDYNGNITDTNIATSGITTYGKVDGSAIKNLANVAVAAGKLPAANVDTLNQNTSGTAANVTGTVAIANGGTGKTTAQEAIDALLPAQGSANGKYLSSNGTNASWGSISAPVVKQVLYGSTAFSATNVYCNLSGGFCGNATGALNSTYFPIAGTLKNLRAQTTSVNARSITVNVNNSDTSLTCSPRTSENASDLTHTVSVSAGDYVSLHGEAQTWSVSYSLEFDPT